MAKLVKHKNTSSMREGALQIPQQHYLLGFVIIFTLILFSKSLGHQFINYDDPQYITNNPLIKDLSLKGLIKIFSNPVIGMYNPLPFVVYSIQYAMWGFNPKYFHLVNLLFHLMAIGAVYNFVWQLSKRYQVALVVALLFAVHPTHTSVVVWASQLKTSMYLIFYFIGLGLYIKSLNYPDRSKSLVTVFVVFLLSLLSKPSAVSLPLMMLLIDWYKGRQINRAVILEKIPFFLLSAIFGVITVVSHRLFGDNIFEISRHYQFFDQVMIANYSIVFYIEKLFVPLNLSSIYPYPTEGEVLPLKYFVSLGVLPLLGFIIYKAGSFRKELVFGLVFFAFAILPVLRLIPAGNFAFANRYTYLSYTGPFFSVAMFYMYLIDGKFKHLNKWKIYFYALFIIAISFFVWRTTIRIKVWENSITVFSDVIKKYPYCSEAYSQRGMSLVASGDYEGGIRDLTRSIELEPQNSLYYNNRALLSMEIGRFEEARVDLNRAIALNPEFAAAYNNLAKCDLFKNDQPAAYNDLNNAIKLNPVYKEAYLNRAMLKLHQGDSIGAYEDALKAQQLGMKEAKAFLNSNFD